MATAHIDERGRLLIPPSMQRRLGLRPGAIVSLRIRGRSLEISAEPERLGPVAQAAWAAHDAGDAVPLAEIEARFGLKRRKPAVRRAAWLRRRTRSA